MFVYTLFHHLSSLVRAFLALTISISVSFAYSDAICRMHIYIFVSWWNKYIVSYITSIRLDFTVFYVPYAFTCVFVLGPKERKSANDKAEAKPALRIHATQYRITVWKRKIWRARAHCRCLCCYCENLTKGWTSFARAVCIRLINACVFERTAFSSIQHSHSIQWTMQWISILIGIKNNSVQGKCCLRAALYCIRCCVLYCSIVPASVFVCVSFLYSNAAPSSSHTFAKRFSLRYHTFQCVKHERIYMLTTNGSVLLGTMTDSEWKRSTKTQTQQHQAMCWYLFFWLDSKHVFAAYAYKRTQTTRIVCMVAAKKKEHKTDHS